MPTPMTVVEHANPLDDGSPIKRVYEPVMDGVCGFAWVVIRPGTCGFAKWLRANANGRKSYYGGEELWVYEFNQSYERKMAFARAYAQVVSDAGIEAHAGGRLD